MILGFISLFGLVAICITWAFICLAYFLFIAKKGKNGTTQSYSNTGKNVDIMAYRPPFTIKVVLLNEEESEIFSDNVVKLSDLLQGRLEVLQQDRVGVNGVEIVEAEKKIISEIMYEGAKPDNEPNYEEVPEIPDLDFVMEIPEEQPKDDDEMADLSLAI